MWLYIAQQELGYMHYNVMLESQGQKSPFTRVDDVLN